VNKQKAIRIAIEAMKRERRRFAFDANLYKAMQAPHAKKSFERYNELSEAISQLEEVIPHQLNLGG